MIDLIFALIFACELIGFYRFYSGRHGQKAVYVTWYAWMIDALGILSGSVIMSIAIFADHHPELFNFDIPFAFQLLVFTIGSWQTLIHAVKWTLRLKSSA